MITESSPATANSAAPVTRGFELQIQLTWSEALERRRTPLLLERFAALQAEFLGEGEQVRTTILRGQMPRDEVLALLNPLLERVKYAEIGLRGYLRSERSTEYMPWKRNVIVKKPELERVLLEEGVKYLLE